jgi:hypothetical protein
MSTLAAMLLAAGELVCDFDAGTMMLYEVSSADRASVLDSRRPGRRTVSIREAEGQLHLIEGDGPSVRVTTLTSCTRGDFLRCTRYAAQHAWHFDAAAFREPAASFQRRPSGSASGRCEPWRIEP